jgi:hypothetical protein
MKVAAVRRCLGLATLLSAASGLRAEQIITYQGNDFFWANPPYNSSDSISVTLTLSSPLPLNDAAYVVGASQIESLSISDGPGNPDPAITVFGDPLGFDTISFTTNQAGIVYWSITLCNAADTVCMETYNNPPAGSQVAAYDTAVNLSSGARGNSIGLPGVWSVEAGAAPGSGGTGQPGSAREPGTGVTMLTGLVLIVAAKLFRSRHKAVRAVVGWPHDFACRGGGRRFREGAASPGLRRERLRRV